MKKVFYCLLLTIMTSLTSNAQSVVNLQANEFVKKIKETKNAQLLDVRTPPEWTEGKIESSNCIDYMADTFKQKVGKMDKTKPVFVYCAAGGRSAKAANVLQQMGFKAIYNLQNGGYKDLKGKVK